jgi:hypothetical protein
VGNGEAIVTASGFRYVVGAHETFAFRTGWLKKGYEAVREDGFALQRDDAVIRLGVGKNMVRSIRFWCLATGMVEEEPRPPGGSASGPYPSGRKPLRPTDIGKRLLDEEGWDPYLEDLASLWLVHWLLVTNPLRASAWWHIFASYADNELTKPRLIAFLQSLVERQQQTVSPTSIARDVDCFLRTYTPSTHSTGSGGACSLPEATFECPLADLELIRPARTPPERTPSGRTQSEGTEGVYRFCVGRKDGLPPHLVGFALLQFARSLHRRSLNLRECLYAPGSPGQAFRLDEDSMLEHLEKLTSLTGGWMDVVETAGVTQIFLHGHRPNGHRPNGHGPKIEHADELNERALALLDDYYRRTDTVPTDTETRWAPFQRWYE